MWWFTRVMVVATAVVGSLQGCSDAPAGGPGAGTDARGGPTGTPADQVPGASGGTGSGVSPVPGECGRQLQVPQGAPVLRAELPAQVRSGSVGSALIGTVSWTWEAGPGKAVGPMSADVLIVDGEGRVVAAPGAKNLVGRPLDLVRGKALTFPVVGNLVTCEQPGRTLPAGSYRVYARVAITHDDGSTTTGFGGPWPLTVIG